MERTEVGVAQLDGTLQNELEDGLRIGPRPPRSWMSSAGRGLAGECRGQLALQLDNAGREHFVSVRGLRLRAWLVCL